MILNLSVVRAGLPAILGRAFALAAGIALVWVITDRLPGDAAGQFLLLLTLANVLATLGRAGTDNLVLKLLNHPDLQTGTVRRLSLLCSFSAALVAISALASLPSTAGHLQLDLTASGWMAVSIFPLALSVFCGSVLRAHDAHARGVVAEAGLQALLVIVTIYVAGVETLVGAAKAYAISCALAACVSAWWAVVVHRRVGDTAESSTGVRRFLAHHRSALFSMASMSVMYYMSTYAPTLVLGLVKDYEGVAALSIATRVAAMVTLIPILRASYLAPRFARLHASGRVDELNLTARRAARMDSAIALGITAIIIPSGDIVSSAFGAANEDVPLLLAVLALGGLAVSIQGQVNPLAMTCGHERAGLALSSLNIASWATIGWLAAYTYGAVGTAVTGSLLATAYAASLSVIMRRRDGITSSPLSSIIPHSSGAAFVSRGDSK